MALTETHKALACPVSTHHQPIIQLRTDYHIPSMAVTGRPDRATGWPDPGWPLPSPVARLPGCPVDRLTGAVARLIGGMPGWPVDRPTGRLGEEMPGCPVDRLTGAVARLTGGMPGWPADRPTGRPRDTKNRRQEHETSKSNRNTRHRIEPKARWKHYK